MSELINLNTALIDYIMTLPGVGPSLAERIVAERPYDTLDDLLRVQGVGPALLDRIQPLVTLTIAEEADIQEEDQTERGFILVEDTESEDNEEPIPLWEGRPSDDQILSPEAGEELLPDETEIPPERAIIPIEVDSSEDKPKKKTNYVRRGEVFIIAAICSLFSFILAVILTLGTIAALNGGLRFASSTQINEFARRLDGMNLQSEILTDDISDLKIDIEQLNVDMSITVDEITAITEDLDDINSEMETLQENSEAFEAFVDGLRDLLNELPEK